MMMARMTALPLGLLLAGAAMGASVPFVDPGGANHGSVSASLSKGVVKMKISGLPALPAQPPGASFTAYVYKAYLTSTADPAVEIFLADVYPNGSGAAKPRVKLGGDVSRLGLDRVVVTAYSKDARESLDVLTASIAP
jgi:hypothetical protein